MHARIAAASRRLIVNICKSFSLSQSLGATCFVNNAGSWGSPAMWGCGSEAPSTLAGKVSLSTSGWAPSTLAIGLLLRCVCA